MTTLNHLNNLHILLDSLATTNRSMSMNFAVNFAVDFAVNFMVIFAVKWNDPHWTDEIPFQSIDIDKSYGQMAKFLQNTAHKKCHFLSLIDGTYHVCWHFQLEICVVFFVCVMICNFNSIFTQWIFQIFRQTIELYDSICFLWFGCGNGVY